MYSNKYSLSKIYQIIFILLFKYFQDDEDEDEEDCFFFFLSSLSDSSLLLLLLSFLSNFLTTFIVYFLSESSLSELESSESDFLFSRSSKYYSNFFMLSKNFSLLSIPTISKISSISSLSISSGVIILLSFESNFKFFP